MKKIKQEIGITLIALVITIIVLLILAGVAISMLSGENGILTRAAEAKENTEKAQKEEETNLTSMDLDSHFIINNSKYKCRYGCITGINLGDKVESLKESLPSGYDIKTKDGADTTDDTIITTGMQVIKDGKEVARTVIFGDINCDGQIIYGEHNDIFDIKKNINTTEKYIIFASDVNHDGYVNNKDAEEVVKYFATTHTEFINNQNFYPQEIKEMYFISNIEFIKKIGITEQQEFEKFEDEEEGIYYKITLNDEYTYKQLRDKIKENKNVQSISLWDSEGKVVSHSSTDKVTQGSAVTIGLQDNEGYLIESSSILLYFN